MTAATSFVGILNFTRRDCKHRFGYDVGGASGEFSQGVLRHLYGFELKGAVREKKLSVHFVNGHGVNSAMGCDRVATGTYHAKPAKVFRLDEIGEAHRTMEVRQTNTQIS